MSMSEQILKEMLDATLKKVESVIKITEEHELQNSQIFLNWLDQLNKLSVSY